MYIIKNKLTVNNIDQVIRILKESTNKLKDLLIQYKRKSKEWDIIFPFLKNNKEKEQ